MERILEEELPVMGICRGMQLLGVASGASIIQDILSVDNTPLKITGISETCGKQIIEVSEYCAKSFSE